MGIGIHNYCSSSAHQLEVHDVISKTFTCDVMMCFAAHAYQRDLRKVKGDARACVQTLLQRFLLFLSVSFSETPATRSAVQ